MKDFFEDLDIKKIVIMTIYVILDVLVSVFLLNILSFRNAEVYVRLKGLRGIKVFQLMMFFFILLMPIVIMRKDAIGFRRKAKIKYGDQGTAKEGSIAELKDLMGKDGFTLSRNVRLSAEKSYEHVAIIGPTGSGKSTSFFIPNLLDLDGVHSAVVTDPKGELHDLTSPYLRKMGYNIIKLVPLEPEKNEFYYNPLLICEDSTQIREIAQLLMTNGNKSVELATGASSGGAEWLNMSVPLLSATLMYVKEFGKKKSINEALDIILNDDLETMATRFKKSQNALRSFLIFKSSAESEKTLSSIKTVLTTNMQLLVDEKIEAFTQTPFKRGLDGEKTIDYSKVFNPKVLREKPTVLFVCVPEIKSFYMMPLMSVFYSQLLDITMTIKEGQPILYMLDEFANIGIIPSISNVTATARSRRIGISLGLQGVEQLRRNYGEDNASDILNNLKTKVIFSGLTGDSAQYVSDLAGVTTIETKSYSEGGQGGQRGFLGGFLGGNTSVSKSGARRELLTADEVRRMDADEVLIIAHNKNVVRDKKNTYYIQKKYKDKLASKNSKKIKK